MLLLDKVIHFQLKYSIIKLDMVFAKKFKFSIGLTAAVLAIIFFLFISNFLQKSKKNMGSIVLEDIPLNSVENLQIDSTLLDIDGDGRNNLVLFLSSAPEEKPYFSGYIVVYDEKLKEIARTSKEFYNLSLLLKGDFFPYKLDKQSKKEYLKITYIAGAHHFRHFFLTRKGNKLVPVCKKEKAKSWDDCGFYNSTWGLEVEDYDEDGLMEVIEFVDEYPPGGGRGDIVVQGIYEFNGEYFRKLEGEEYMKIYKLVEKDYYKTIEEARKEEMSITPVLTPPRKLLPYSKDRKTMLEEVKKFWEGGR